MSVTLDKTLAAAPATARGQPTPLSTDSKGQRIAYASGKSIFVRSIDDPSSCKQYNGHTAQTTVARFSPSGFYVASGDATGAVRVWDSLEAVNTKGEYHIISGRINDIAWDGDSQRIIAVGDGRERFGHCITADSGNSVGEVSGHSKVINSVAIRPMRPLRAATVADDMSMCFLHGAPFKFNSKAAGLHKGFVFATAFSLDGNSLVTVGADKRIQLYDGKTGEPTRDIGQGEHTGSIFAVSWAPDSKRFVTASADQTVKMWDVEAGTVLRTWRVGPEGSSIPDQQVGVVWPHGRDDGLIISLSLSGDLNYLQEGSEKPVRVVQGHNKSVTAMGSGSEGSGTLWTGSFDGRVCGWDVASGEGAAVRGNTHTNQVTQFAADGTGAGARIYSVGWDDTLRAVDEAAREFASPEGGAKLSAQPQGVAVGAAGAVYVATPSGVDVYTDGGATRVGSIDISDAQPTAIAAHAGSGLVAVGVDSKSVRLFKASSSPGSLTPAGGLDATEPASAVTALAFSTDGAKLAAGTSAGKIYAYSVSAADGQLKLETDRWSAHTGRVTGVAWSASGAQCASAALDTNVHVWSLAKPGQRARAPNAHKDGAYGVAWLGGDRLASTGGDAAVKLWKVEGVA